MTGEKNRLVILGASGMLGQSMRLEHFRPDWVIVTVGSTRGDTCDHSVDATNESSLAQLLDEVQPVAVLNLTGLTSVDDCEQHPRKAYHINTKIAENLARWRENGHDHCYILHLSTDHVYHGDGPHNEECAEPSNYYALSKYAAELAINGGNSAIMRTNFFGASALASRRSFSDWLFESLSEGRVLDVYSDVRFSPLSMSTLSMLLARILRLRAVGVYNLGSRSGLSKAEFALQFAAEAGLNQSHLNVKPSPALESGRAYRPKDMRMDVSRIEALLGESMPTLMEEIQKVIPEYLS